MTTIEKKETQAIPKAAFAVIGGSGTLSSDFPLGAQAEDVTILADGLFFSTPYGQSPAFRLFEVAGEKVLTCKMHGWRSGTSRADGSKQIFWVFREAGVKRIFEEDSAVSRNDRGGAADADRLHRAELPGLRKE